jgi:hypothetical protein
LIYAYFGYVDGTSTAIDINSPATATNYLPVGKWAHVAVSISRTGGVTVYVDGALKTSTAYRYSGTQDGEAISKKSQIDFNRYVDFVGSCANF